MSTGLEISPLNLDLGFGNVRQVSSASISAPATGAEQTSFADTLKSAGLDVVNSLKNAEAASVAGIKGDAGPYEVAATMMEAEQNLRMTVAIRDKFIQSYLEISRMQI